MRETRCRRCDRGGAEERVGLGPARAGCKAPALELRPASRSPQGPVSSQREENPAQLFSTCSMPLEKTRPAPPAASLRSGAGIILEQETGRSHSWDIRAPLPEIARSSPAKSLPLLPAKSSCCPRTPRSDGGVLCVRLPKPEATK